MNKSISMSKAEIARQLGVSRTYITLLAQGKRKPSQELVDKLNSLHINNASRWGSGGRRFKSGHPDHRWERLVLDNLNELNR